MVLSRILFHFPQSPEFKRHNNCCNTERDYIGKRQRGINAQHAPECRHDIKQRNKDEELPGKAQESALERLSNSLEIVGCYDLETDYRHHGRADAQRPGTQQDELVILAVEKAHEHTWKQLYQEPAGGDEYGCKLDCKPVGGAHPVYLTCSVVIAYDCFAWSLRLRTTHD